MERDQQAGELFDLTDPRVNRIYNMSIDEARARVLGGSPEAVRAIDGSFALVARDGLHVRMARTLDRPLRFFLAKKAEGPALIVADRIDALYRLKGEIVRRGVLAVTGIEMPVYPKRRFQHGISRDPHPALTAGDETSYRRILTELHPHPSA